MILKEVVSYATRKPRKDEVEGREHYFISKDKGLEMLENGEAKIFTYINDVLYFATDEEIRNKNTYKIDPIGLYKLKKEYPDIKIKTIYIYAPDAVRKKRSADSRGNLYNFEERNSSENEQFRKFESDKAYDIKIENIDLKESRTELLLFLERNPADLYCFIGRTGAGKDTLIREVNNVLEKMDK